MKFKVGILDNDTVYLERLAQYFSSHYPDKLELYSYSDRASFADGVRGERFDLVLLSELIGITKEEIPEGVNAAYLVTQNDVDKLSDITAIGKYQKPEQLYKQIMTLCMEKNEMHFSRKNAAGQNCKVLLFCGAAGGMGTSTVAAACAKNLARTGKKVMYLSFEKNAVTDLFFDTYQETTFSDVIYMLKSKKNNILLRMESIVQKDTSGVFFFKQCANTVDMEELDTEDTRNLVQEICSMGDYEYLVIDSELRFNEIGFFLSDYADAIIMVADGSHAACCKLMQFAASVAVLDKQKGTRIGAKTDVIYNRFASRGGEQAQVPFQVVGGTPKYEGANEKQLSEQIANMQFFRKYQ